MSTTKRIKRATLNLVPQSKTAAAEAIAEIGRLQRQFEAVRAEMNNAISQITAQHQPTLEVLNTQITKLQEGVQAWCEAHRTELCGEGDKLGKTANLITGEVSWRVRPPSVRITGADAVTDTLLRMGLGRFVRVHQEPNKEAMLNEPEAVRGIGGITIVSGVEDFAITPFEVEAELAAGA